MLGGLDNVVPPYIECHRSVDRKPTEEAILTGLENLTKDETAFKGVDFRTVWSNRKAEFKKKHPKNITKGCWTMGTS